MASIVNEQNIQNAIEEKGAQMEHLQPLANMVPTANIEPIQNPSDNPRQINRSRITQQHRKQHNTYSVNDMAVGFQYQSNLPPQIGHSRGPKNNQNLASRQQSMGTQVPQLHPDNNIDDLLYGDFLNLINILNKQPQSGWKTLAAECKIRRGTVMEFGHSDNPTEQLLNYLQKENNITLGELKTHLENAGLNDASSFLRCEDLQLYNENRERQIDDESDITVVPTVDNTVFATMGQKGVQFIDQIAHTGRTHVNVNAMDDGSQLTVSGYDNQFPDNTDLDENGYRSVELENRSLTGNSLKTNTVTSKNNVYLNRQNVPDKTVEIDNQPIANKSDSVAMKNTHEVLENSGKNMQNGATPSVSNMQALQASHVTSSLEAKLYQKIEQETKESSEIQRNDDPSDQESARSLSSQRPSFSSEANKSLTSEQTLNDMSLIKDGKPESQNVLELQQQASTGKDDDIEDNSAKYGIQVTSVGGLTDNPNIPTPLTNVLSGNNSDKQGATSLSNTKEKNNCPDEEATDDKIRDPDQVTSMDGRTDNQYIADPLTKALSENNNGDNTEKLKNKRKVKQECDVLDVTSDHEGTDYPVQVTSLGGKTDNPNNAADLTKALSKNSDLAQSGASSLDTDTTEKKSIVSDPNANSGAVTENSFSSETVPKERNG